MQLFLKNFHIMEILLRIKIINLNLKIYRNIFMIIFYIMKGMIFLYTAIIFDM